MSDNEKESPGDKIEPLKETVRSYVKWSKAMLRSLKSMSKFRKVIAYAVEGKDEILDEFEPLPGNNQAVNRKNERKEDKKEKFDDTSGGFIGKLQKSISSSVMRAMEEKDEYNDIIEENDARAFWELIKEVIIEENTGRGSLGQAQNYLFKIRQDKFESFKQYEERFMNVVEEIEFLNSTVSETVQNQLFLQGFHPRYQKVKERIKEDADIDEKPIREIVEMAIRLERAHRDDKPKIWNNHKPNTGTNPGKVVAGLNNNKSDKSKTSSEPQTKRSKIVCFRCQKEGHISRDCKSGYVNSSQNGKPSSSTYLDTLATISLTNHMDELRNITNDDRTFTNANGEVQNYSIEGDHPILGRTAFLESAPMEIASFKNIRNKFKPSYSDDVDTFTFQNRETGKIELKAKQADGIYPITPVIDHSISGEFVLGISQQNSSDKLLELHERLLHTNYANLKKSVALGHYSDVIKDKIKLEDWKRVIECLTCKLSKDGRLLGQERGKNYTKRRSNVQFREEPVEIVPELQYNLENRMDVELYFDLVYVGGDICNLMLVKPHNYLLMQWITKRDINTLLNSILYLVNKVKAGNGIERVVSISVDREKAVYAIEERIVIHLVTQLKQAVPYKHERNIERQVRTVRNRYRCLLQDLKIPLTRTLKRLAWEHVVKASNFTMNTNCGEYIPYQIQYKSKEYRTPPKFGEFVVASVGKPNSKETPRNQVGMIVGFEESTRAVMVKFRGQNQIVIRDSYRVISRDEGLQRYMEDYHDYEDEIEDEDDLGDYEDQVTGDAFGEIE